MKILNVQRGEFSPALDCLVLQTLLSHWSDVLFLHVQKAQARSLALSSNSLKILLLGIPT